MQHIQQVIQNTTAAEFRSLGLSSKGVSSDALLPGQATNVGTMGASADDEPALPTLGGVVWIVGSTSDAPPPGMVRTS
jgi:hypothetical protein